MKKGTGVLILITFLALPFCANAVVIDLYGNEIIDAAHYDSVGIDIAIHNAAVVDMISGEVGSVYSNDSCIFNLHDGTIWGLYAYDVSSINLYGGTVVYGFQAWEPTSEINIYGYDFSTTIKNQRIYLSGKWEDGSVFSFYFFRSLEIPENVVLHEIPEPCMLGLFGFGLFLMRRNLKINHR